MRFDDLRKYFFNRIIFSTNFALLRFLEYSSDDVYLKYPTKTWTDPKIRLAEQAYNLSMGLWIVYYLGMDIRSAFTYISCM